MADSHEQLQQSYDVLLLGATGYTGQLVAQRLRERFDSTAWAVAGRSEERLEKLVVELGKTGRSSFPIIEVIDLHNDEPHLREVIRRAKVVINTAGPFAEHGEGVFKICAQEGKHYVDCTGETPWLKEMIERYDNIARQNGAIMVPSCGFGSVPADLLTSLLVRRCRSFFQARALQITISIQDIQVSPSSGSILSAVHTIGTYGLGKSIAAAAPFALSPTVPPDGSTMTKILGSRMLKKLGFGVTGMSLQTDHDRAIIHRTWGLFEKYKPFTGAYGPFAFQSVMRFPSTARKLLFTAWYYSTVLLLTMPWARAMAKQRYLSGGGLDVEKRTSNFFEYRAVGVADLHETQREELATTGTNELMRMGASIAKMRFNGDVYDFTALALAEAAVQLANGATGSAAAEVAGVVTPSMLGEEFAKGLTAGGLQLEVDGQRYGA